jgi:transposase InsO family protein
LGVIEAVEHWRYYLWGVPFEVRILSDHRSLEFLRTQRDLSGKMARWQERISEFEYRIEYLPGRENVLADALSRLPQDNTAHTQTTSILHHLQHAAPVDDTFADNHLAAVCIQPSPWQKEYACVTTRSRHHVHSDDNNTPVDNIVLDDNNTLPDDTISSPSLPTPPHSVISPTTLVTTSSKNILPDWAAVPLVNDPLQGILTGHHLLDQLDYSADPEFGPICEIFRRIDADTTLRTQYSTQPLQLDVTLFPTELRKFIPKLLYYQFTAGRLYNLSGTGSIALVIPSTGGLRVQLLTYYHNDKWSGHRAGRPTYNRLRQQFYWHGMLKQVEEFVTTCDTCHRSKSRSAAPYGLLESPRLPNGPGEQISIDFIMDLAQDPISGHDAILVVVDRFTKLVTLIPTNTSVTGQGTAELLYTFIFTKRGYPFNIIMDRDPRFRGRWFTDFCHYSGIKASMSSGNHPETDGSTERMIRTFEEAVRSFIDYTQVNLWAMLPDFEFALNDYVNPVTGVTAFYAFYGYNPLRPVEIGLAAYKNSSVQSLQDHFDHLLSTQSHIRDSLRQAQSKYVYQANKHRRAVPLDTFRVGNHVYVHRDNFLPPAMRRQPTRKFQPRFFGPYTIISQVSPTSFRLRMPATVRTHPVFHASQLKLHPTSEQFPERTGGRVDPVVHDGVDWYDMETLLDTRKFRRHIQYLVKWKHYPMSESTWVTKKSLIEDGFIDEIHKYHSQHTTPLLAPLFVDNSPLSFTSLSLGGGEV